MAEARVVSILGDDGTSAADNGEKTAFSHKEHKYLIIKLLSVINDTV